MDIAWNSQQASALDKVGRWLQTRDRQLFTLGGYAGTGKTTLARHLASMADGNVLFAAYTGKAAHVLHQMGVESASTIHSLIYTPKKLSQQRLQQLRLERMHCTDPIQQIKLDNQIRDETSNLARPAFTLNLDSELKRARLLIVDEYSMLDEQIGQDLMSFGTPILALGDPGQLGPVKGRPFITDAPDVMLTDVRRQAADSPVIWLATEARQGHKIQPGRYGDSLVLSYSDIGPDGLREQVLAAEQLLTWRNATRLASNRRFRELRGIQSKYPVTGDRLVCLRNDHEVGLLNGQLWIATQDAEIEGSDLVLHLQADGEPEITVCTNAHKAIFDGKPVDPWSRTDAQEFDYGYALTVHKAQGSQWPSILLMDEYYGAGHARWRYTGITRAQERVVLVDM